MNQENKKEFTFSEIMNAIGKMDPIYGKAVLLFGYGTIEQALNDIGSGTMINLLQECDERANFYMGLRRSLVALHNTLNGINAEVLPEGKVADEERE